MKMVLLGVVLWAGLTFGSHLAPYPLNLIASSGKQTSETINIVIDYRLPIRVSATF